MNTQILLYTRRNRKAPDIISYSNISGTLPLSKFNISAPLKVIIHGFGSSCQRVWPSEMRLALLTVVGKLLAFILKCDHIFLRIQCTCFSFAYNMVPLANFTQNLEYQYVIVFEFIILWLKYFRQLETQ